MEHRNILDKCINSMSIALLLAQVLLRRFDMQYSLNDTESNVSKQKLFVFLVRVDKWKILLLLVDVNLLVRMCYKVLIH